MDYFIIVKVLLGMGYGFWGYGAVWFVMDFVGGNRGLLIGANLWGSKFVIGNLVLDSKGM